MAGVRWRCTHDRFVVTRLLMNEDDAVDRNSWRSVVIVVVLLAMLELFILIGIPMIAGLPLPQ